MLRVEAFHAPVMTEEVLHFLRPGPGQIMVDATVGGGGHASLISPLLGPDGVLVCLDMDEEALAHSRSHLQDTPARLVFHQGSFRDMARILSDLGTGLVNGILFDLGVSSHQLDTPERGFSYWHSGPLDMRLGTGIKTTAGDLVNRSAEVDLSRIIARYGEEKWASRIASFIVKERQKNPIETTQQLVEIIKNAIPASARRKGPHPARRTFQALRIAANDELGSLERGLGQAVEWLAHEGRVVCLSYHSLEDRIVKKMMRDLEGQCTCPPGLPVCACQPDSRGTVVTHRPVLPGKAEVEANPRARSARLRCFERRVLHSRGGE